MAVKYRNRAASWGKASRGFSTALGKAGEHLSGWAREWMSEAADSALKQIDAEWPRETRVTRIGFGHMNVKTRQFGGDHEHPWYTGQLHDSVAGVVSDKNRTVSINYMPPAATSPQNYKGFNHIIGHEWAITKARDAEYVFLPGIQAKLIVGVPYADKVDSSSRHYDFVRSLNNYFASYVEDYFTEKAQGFRTRVFVADTKK